MIITPALAATILFVPSTNCWAHVLPQTRTKSTIVSPPASSSITRRSSRLFPLANSGSRDSDTSSETNKRKRIGWIKKVFGKSKSKQLSMRAPSAMTDEPKTTSSTTDFLMRNFETVSPALLFPESMLQKSNSKKSTADTFSFTRAELSVIEEVQDLVKSESLSAVPEPLLRRGAHIHADDELPWDGGSPLTRLTRSWAQSILTKLLDRWTDGLHENLIVKCAPTGSAMDWAKGHFRCDASVDVDRIVLPCLRMSGGRLEARRLALNLWTFTSDIIPVNAPRYPNQFDLLAHNATFTQDDLFQSQCIRNGLRQLLTRILNNRGIRPSSVAITSIDILPNGKLSVQGEANTLFGGVISRLPFEVRTHLAQTSRGHVITFPGLEIALNPQLGFFVPVLPEISLDLGNNAQILDIQLDGKRAEMRLSARATITPDHTLKLRDYTQPSNSYAAPFSIDVGRWLTGVGNFAD